MKKNRFPKTSEQYFYIENEKILSTYGLGLKEDHERHNSGNVFYSINTAEIKLLEQIVKKYNITGTDICLIAELLFNIKKDLNKG